LETLEHQPQQGRTLMKNEEFEMAVARIVRAKKKETIAIDLFRERERLERAKKDLEVVNQTKKDLEGKLDARNQTLAARDEKITQLEFGVKSLSERLAKRSKLVEELEKKLADSQKNVADARARGNAFKELIQERLD
jgi:flagellar biosynthesis chaperone FliJ